MKTIYINWSNVTHATSDITAEGKLNVKVYAGQTVVHSELIEISEVSEFVKDIKDLVKVSKKEANLPL